MSSSEEIYASSNEYEATKRWRSVFEKVISAYRDVLEMSPVVANTYDWMFPNRRLGPDTINYKIDVEHATSRTLKDPALMKAWRRIVAGDETVPAAVARQIIKKCGREYSLTKLAPFDYFRNIRKGSPDKRKPAMAGATA